MIGVAEELIGNLTVLVLLLIAFPFLWHRLVIAFVLSVAMSVPVDVYVIVNVPLTVLLMSAMIIVLAQIV
jgi:hypothetical protein